MNKVPSRWRSMVVLLLVGAAAISTSVTGQTGGLTAQVLTNEGKTLRGELGGIRSPIRLDVSAFAPSIGPDQAYDIPLAAVRQITIDFARVVVETADRVFIGPFSAFRGIADGAHPAPRQPDLRPSHRLPARDRPERRDPPSRAARVVGRRVPRRSHGLPRPDCPDEATPGERARAALRDVGPDRRDDPLGPGLFRDSARGNALPRARRDLDRSASGRLRRPLHPAAGGASSGDPLVGRGPRPRRRARPPLPPQHGRRHELRVDGRSSR